MLIRTIGVMPRLLQTGVNENFNFTRNITTSSELRISSGIYFSNLGIDITH